MTEDATHGMSTGSTVPPTETGGDTAPRMTGEAAHQAAAPGTVNTGVTPSSTMAAAGEPAAPVDEPTAVAGEPTASAGAPVAPVRPAAAYTHTAAPHEVRKAKPRRWIAPLIVLLLLLGLIIGAVSACSSLFNTQKTSYKPNTIAVITMDGTMGYDGTVNSPEGLKKQLDDAASEEHIKAIVLRVNSGGGTAAAGEEMATYLDEFEKPVVVSSAALNASAAYMISSQADYIYVLRTTDIGGIGTILQHYDLSELYEKLGINVENIKSAESKDASYYDRPLTDEERARYQCLIDAINDVFIDLVAKGRGMDVAEVRKLADGMTWVGPEAVDLGLADEVGTFDDACAKAAELAGLGDDYDVTDIGKYNSSLADYLWILGSKEASEEERILEALKEILENDGIVR